MSGSACSTSTVNCPASSIGQGGVGYMADPQPVHLAASNRSGEQIISGTTKALLCCTLPIKPGCFTSTPLRVGVEEARRQLDAAKVQVTNLQNIDLFQDDAGTWHAAATVGVNSARHAKHWTVVAHAHPVGSVPLLGPPLTWSVDALLTGSLTEAVNGNYDGKYYEENGQRYLLYIRGIAPPPALRNSIVLQPMISPTELAPREAATLLTPGDRDGELNSESYANTQAKLVEPRT